MRKLLNEELNRLSLDEIKSARKNPVVIVLDNVRSMNNIGSAFRTADAFLCAKIMLCGITAQPPHREIHRTALGATESVEWEYFKTTEQAIENLRNEGYLIASIEQAHKSTSLESFNLEPEQKIAVVFGNEVKGVQDSIIDISDEVIEIPQFGTKHSLNISVSIGVVVWELMRKIKFDN